MTQRHRGYIERIIDLRGFAFIKCTAHRKNVFLHCSELKDTDFEQLLVGSEVEFEMVDMPKGMAAKAVTLIQQ